MRRTFLLAPMLLCFLSLASGPSSAQYIYMDSNGDGVNGPGDRLKVKGRTNVDVYLITNRNRDGSEAVCNTSSEPLQFFSFSLGFRAVGGTVSFGDLTDAPVPFNFIYSLLKTDTEYHVFYGIQPGDPWAEPGQYHLGRVKVNVTSGSPSLEFAPVIGFEQTSFGTPCPGLDGDNTYKLGSDFFDSDGLPASGTPAGGSSVAVSPNPMNPTGKLAFETSRAGRVRVQFFDLSGHLVRSVMDEAALPAGRHEVLFDGRGDRGDNLASGLYLYRITRPEGAVSGKFMIAR